MGKSNCANALATRSPKGTVAPGEFARELGLDEQSPALPHWLGAWSQSCDDMSLQLRGEEANTAQAPR